MRIEYKIILFALTWLGIGIIRIWHVSMVSDKVGESLNSFLGGLIFWEGLPVTLLIASWLTLLLTGLFATVPYAILAIISIVIALAIMIRFLVYIFKG